MENTVHYYFYLSEGIQRGPVPAEQLRGYITEETLVWREGLAQWTPAGQLAELRPYIEGAAATAPDTSAAAGSAVPPHYSAPVRPQSTPPAKPNNYLIWSILLTFFCSSVTGLIGVVFGITCNQRYAAGDYRGAEYASNVARNCIYISVIAAVVMFIVAGSLLASFGGALGAFVEMMENGGDAFME